jgi:hypothetical protein
MTPAEEEHLRFYAALGNCLGQWSHVEDALCTVFVEAVGATHKASSKTAATAAFYSVMAAEAKIDITHSAVSFRLRGDTNSELLNRWRTLYNSADRKRQRRNNLAHFQVLIHPNTPKGRKYELRPLMMDPNNLLKYADKLKQMPSLFQADLETIRESFGKLFSGLQQFAALLAHAK